MSPCVSPLLNIQPQCHCVDLAVFQHRRKRAYPPICGEPVDQITDCIRGLQCDIFYNSLSAVTNTCHGQGESYPHIRLPDPH